jgi:hypothetical protein
MQAREDEDKNRFLAIVIELAPGETASDERRDAATRMIVRELRRLNSEFANYVPPASQLPHVQLKALGDSPADRYACVSRSGTRADSVNAIVYRTQSWAVSPLMNA